MYNTTEEVVALVKAFEERRLARADWTHAALLTVGLYYCVRFSFGFATNLMRDGICALNDAHGIPNAKASGYHETMTVFWMIVIKQFVEISQSQCHNLAKMANELVAICSDPRLPLEYYSRELLISSEAREEHVQPDLDDLYLFVNLAKLAARTGGYGEPQFT
jgi:hypothetical protein